jgi:alanine dehydrogenase
MDRVIGLLDAAFRSWAAGTAACQPRQRVRAPGGSMLQLMGAADSQAGYIGYKAYTASRGGYFPYVMLFDAKSGQPLALIEADYLGQMRTGAASGLATKHMARADGSVLGVIGTGGQAVTQIQAIAAVRELAEVRVFGRDPERRKEFASRVSDALHLTVRACESAQEAVAGAAIVVTITTSSQPVFFGAWIEPGMHINAAGGNAASRSELDAAAVTRADRIVVDSIEQCKIEAGELLAVDRWSEMVELSQVVAGKAAGRGSAGEVTLFKSNGIALEDVALAGWLFEQIK